MNPNELISEYGYWGVAFVLFLDIIGVPFPAQMTLALCGIAWASGSFEALPLFSTVILAHVAGSTVAFLIGRNVGLPLILRIGKRFGLTEVQFATAETKFKNHEQSIIFFGKFLPLISVWIIYIAGINKMSFTRFTLINALSTVCWAFLFLYLGRALGVAFFHFEEVFFDYFEKYGVPFVIIAILAVVGFKWVRRNN